jgi:peptidoglycan/xylan/chitin deacetylase (PgdA/CDA1 family)
MMTGDEVRALASAGMEIAAHTHTHPILSKLEAADAEREIQHGKDELEWLLDRPVSLFAYPNGKPVQDFLPEHADMARRAGFAAAVTTAPGWACKTTDPFLLPRFTPWDRTQWRFGLRLLHNLRRTT